MRRSERIPVLCTCQASAIVHVDRLRATRNVADREDRRETGNEMATSINRLLLRKISDDTFTTYLGDVEYVRTDVMDNLERVRRQHVEKAKQANFNDCGCAYCEALSPAEPSQEG